jgi:hypothetical protein
VKSGNCFLLPEENSSLISFLPFILSAFGKPNIFLLPGSAAISNLSGPRPPAVFYLSSSGAIRLYVRSWFSCGGENRAFSAFSFDSVDMFASYSIIHKAPSKSRWKNPIP